MRLAPGKARGAEERRPPVGVSARPRVWDLDFRVVEIEVRRGIRGAGGNVAVAVAVAAGEIEDVIVALWAVAWRCLVGW